MRFFLYLCIRKHTAMMYILFFILLFLPLSSLDADLSELSYALDCKADYDRAYEHRLDSLYVIGDPLKLYKAYNSYCFDSALYYIQQVVEQSEHTEDYDRIASAKIKLAYIYMSGGRFRECESTFLSLDEKRLAPRHLTGYYSLKGHLLYDIARYEGTVTPPQMRSYYETALIHVSPNDSINFWNLSAQLAYIDGDYQQAIHCFERAYEGTTGHLHSEAIFLSSIAQVYLDRGDSAEALHYWSQAAIRDIASSTKEVTAMQQVAQLLYQLGHYDMADRCIRSALDDAQHYHARHRQLEVGEIIPIIDSHQISQLRNRAIRIRALYACIVILLLLGALILIRILHKLHLRNQLLTDAQEKIRLSNTALEESNRTKESYLTAMLSAEVDHTEATERYVKHVIRYAREKNWEKLLETPTYINKMRQRAAFCHRFDNMFLHLYPHFIEEVNNLLNEPMVSKEGSLPSEFRVFALMRLGVTDNEQMAHILSCSVATIHTYKARVYAQLKINKSAFIEQITTKISKS